jgi:hypothetical protein
MRGRGARWGVIALAVALLAGVASFTAGPTTSGGADAASAAVAPMASSAHDVVFAAGPNGLLDRARHTRPSSQGSYLALAVLTALSMCAAASPRRAAIFLVAADEGLRVVGRTRTRAPPSFFVPA